METHEHRCRECGVKWAHGDDMVGDEAAHRCPVCGYLQWDRYRPLWVDAVVLLTLLAVLLFMIYSF